MTDYNDLFSPDSDFYKSREAAHNYTNLAPILEKKGMDTSFAVDPNFIPEPLDATDEVTDEVLMNEKNFQTVGRILYDMDASKRDAKEEAYEAPEVGIIGSRQTNTPRTDVDFGRYALEQLGFFNYNMAQMGYDTITMQKAEPYQRLAFYYGMNAYDRLKNFTKKGTARFFKGILSDPSTYLGLGSLGLVTRQLAKQVGGKNVLLNLIKNAGVTGTVGGVEGGAYGAIDNYFRQEIGIEASGQKEFNFDQLLKAAGYGVAGGSVLGGSIPVAGAVGKEAVNLAKRVEIDDSATLSANPIPLKLKPKETTVSEEPFYSAVEDAVNNISMEKGAGEQFLGMLQNTQGVKQEELDWIGLTDYLKENKNVNKKDVQDYVKNNKVNIVEIKKNENIGTFNYAKERVADEIELITNNDENLYNNIENITPVIEKLRNATIENKDDIIQELADTLPTNIDNNLNRTNKQYLDDILNEQIKDAEMNSPSRAETLGGTKYGGEATTLAGGKNYRELLLTLPTNYNPKNVTFKERIDSATQQYVEIFYNNQRIGTTDKFIDGDTNKVKTNKDLMNLAKTLYEGNEFNMGTASEFKDDVFKGTHFKEPNVLSHIRLNDRVVNGEKILFIEEIQSDWHQLGREKSYKLSEKEIKPIRDEVDKIRKEGQALARSAGLPNDMVNLYHARKALDDPKYNASKDVLEKMDSYVEKERQLLDSIPTSNVPDAPLKKEWYKTSFRRVVRMAAEEGYDKVAWTPGKLQAERYDLSKKIQFVRAEKFTSLNQGKEEKMFNIEVLTNDDELIDLGTLNKEQISERLGKELTDKIMKQKQNKTNYEGLDLQVGGEGMKTFYDKMLKQYADKWGKKFNSKVYVSSIDKARDYDVFTMDITPSMKQKVLEKGVPLFSAGAGTVTAGGIAAAKQKQEQQTQENSI
ncbi:hypothetical protein [uncultured Mediterranean phage uvMED]|nr:hypothetical protein [uncultured Mediterranean phage uvMED]